MSIAVTITAGGVAYDCSDYVIRHSIEIDEYLFSPDSLKPNTNKATLVLSRTCPYIDEILAATGDISIAISSGGVAAFTGYLTDNFGIGISARGMGDMAITAEDPGIKLLKKPWASTGGLWTDLTGKKVCDPADTGNSFVHILAALAGATVAAGAPTVSNVVYFSVQDKDKKQYWDVLEKVLYDYGYVFYFNAAGELALYSLASLTGTPSLTVRSDATILQKSLGDAGIEIRKRFIQYQEAIVNYREAETVSSAVVFRDTTNQGLTDCDIEIAAGAYYPDSADASTYAFIDYFLEDGRDILAMTSAASDFVVDSGITYEFTHLGKSAKIRFYNPTALPKHIRKLKVTGSGVVVVKAESTMTSNEGGGKKLEYDADYLTANADAQSLANLLRYVYANSTSLYNFRACHGVLYPADDLYPSTTLYPLGDTLTIGSLVNLLDPVWTSLDVNCAIYRKKYLLGRDGASYEALGIGSINLADTTARRPIAVPNARPIVGLYPTEKAIASTSDTVDFDGQYGVLAGQRYVGTQPTTWTLDDAGQTAADVATAVPTYAPAYLGAHLDSAPAVHKSGDSYLRYSATSGTANRGVFVSDGSTFTRTTDPIYVYKALTDIVYICQLKDTDGATALYGVEADYGIDTSIQTAHIMAAIIDRLRVGDIQISGTLKSSQMDTVNAQTGETINAPTPTYWPGADLVTHCAGLADGWHAATGTLDGKTVTHVVKGGSDNTVSYQSDDTETSPASKSLVSGVKGRVTVFFDGINTDAWKPNFELRVNGVTKYSVTPVGNAYVTYSATVDLAIGDTVAIGVAPAVGYNFFKNFRICPATGTVGIWNSTDPSALSVHTGSYHNEAGNVDVDTLTDFVTADQDIYWKGSELITALSGKVTNYRTLDLGGGTFNGKTCETIYYSPTLIQLGYVSGADDVIRAESYYTYTGSIVLDTVEGRVLMGDETGDGQYEQWVHNIPGTSDLIITWRNTVSGAIHSITETRAPDRSSGSIEATHSLHAVHNSVDYVRDLSLHNYSGNMHVLDVFSNFTDATLGDWKWYQQRRVVAWEAETAYAVGDLVYNDPAAGINKIYRCTYAQGTGTSSASGGPTGTGVLISDGTYPNDLTWQYIGVETSAGSAMWGTTVSRLYGLDGSLATIGGWRVTGKIQSTSQTEEQIFAAMAPYFLTVDAEIAVSGIIDGYTVSHAKRTASYQIYIYGANGSGLASIEINGLSTDAHTNISLSW